MKRRFSDVDHWLWSAIAYAVGGAAVCLLALHVSGFV